MKKTSRRDFAKSVAVGLAAAPFATSLANSKTALPSNESQEKPGQKTKPKVNQHDTPPTLTFNDGSFEIESTEQLRQIRTNPWIYGSTFSGNTKIAHIRVLHGNGDLVYQNLEAEGSTILIELRKKGAAQNLNSVTISSANEVTITSRHNRLDEPTAKPKGWRRYKRQQPGAASDEFRIQRIKIENSNNSFDVKLDLQDDDDAFAREYRVLVWLE